MGRFAKALKLNGGEARFFGDLVAFNQASTASDKNAAFDRVAASRRFAKARRIERAFFTYLSSWYYPAIREMAGREDIRPDMNRRRSRDITRRRAHRERGGVDVEVSVPRRVVGGRAAAPGGGFRIVRLRREAIVQLPQPRRRRVPHAPAQVSPRRLVRQRRAPRDAQGHRERARAHPKGQEVYALPAW